MLPEPPPDLKTNRLTLPPPTKNEYTETQNPDNQSESVSHEAISSMEESSDLNLKSDEPLTFTSSTLPMNDEPLKFNMNNMKVGPQFLYSHTSRYRPPSYQSSGAMAACQQYNQAGHTEYQELSQVT